MRTFYSEYVQHCMRFYVRHPSPKFHSDADKQNWKACEDALSRFTDDERNLLMEIYEDNDTIADCVYRVATKHNMKQDIVWKLLNELERRVAKRRNLI